LQKNGGVLRRTGHTEAAIDFARLAGFKSAGVIVEIMNDDGTMSRLPQLFKVAEKFNLRIVSIEDLVAYRMKNDSLISKSFDDKVKTSFGNYRLRAYKQTNNDQVHIALTLGDWNKDEPILTRINSSVVDNDVTKILTGTNEKNYDKIFSEINKKGKGAVIFINQNQSSENILNKLNSLSNDSEKPKIDFRDFGIGAQILHDLDIYKVNLLSNSEHKHRVGLSGYGLSIVDYTNY
jgi:3,4-dihydroxy 2-butanone 4-phosphate synthase/GTP cyclohydrolase II